MASTRRGATSISALALLQGQDFDSFLESARAVLNAFAETKRNLEEIFPGKWPAIADMKFGSGEME